MAIVVKGIQFQMANFIKESIPSIISFAAFPIYVLIKARYLQLNNFFDLRYNLLVCTFKPLIFYLSVLITYSQNSLAGQQKSSLELQGRIIASAFSYLQLPTLVMILCVSNSIKRLALYQRIFLSGFYSAFSKQFCSKFAISYFICGTERYTYVPFLLGFQQSKYSTQISSIDSYNCVFKNIQAGLSKKIYFKRYGNCSFNNFIVVTREMFNKILRNLLKQFLLIKLENGRTKSNCDNFDIVTQRPIGATLHHEV